VPVEGAGSDEEEGGGGLGGGGHGNQVGPLTQFLLHVQGGGSGGNNKHNPYPCCFWFMFQCIMRHVLLHRVGAWTTTTTTTTTTVMWR
jgi:hypothetical protein